MSEERLIEHIVPYMSKSINNYKTKLATTLSEEGEEVTLSDSSPHTGIPWGPSWATEPDWNLGYPLTLTDGQNVEIVYVYKVNPNDDTVVSVLRGREGTEPRLWPADTVAECRLTSGVINYLLNWNELLYTGGVVIGEQAIKRSPEWGGICIGHYAMLLSDEVDKDEYYEGFGDRAYCVAVGNWSQCQSVKSVAIGDESAVWHPAHYGVAIGWKAQVGTGMGSAAIGAEAYIDDSPKSVSIGGYAICKDAPDSIALGYNAKTEAPGAISLGQGIASINGGLRSTAISYLPSDVSRPIYRKDFEPVAQGEIESLPELACGAAMQSVFSTAEIDLTNETATADLELPENTILLIDSLDWITTVSDTPDGAPEIQIGTDETEDNTLLAATPVTATDLHARQTFSPAHSNGVTSVRVAVAVAATGTLKGKLVVRGYVMEV
ncbi:Head domain of trimeric autotransporter adhesin [Marinospirillum celere]|uniref:Head domain of trimeric autotransporter adhesin n=1 Tax=Marinospirillum celere TaxID=1122252 RepID=A0A1I1E164_9GAMM|nr:hypothetical protein [Marinospirillum celere]SFB80911.1 Head domain of trimeric autotransporter adhesin [Marinospirillum celere]